MANSTHAPQDIGDSNRIVVYNCQVYNGCVKSYTNASNPNDKAIGGTIDADLTDVGYSLSFQRIVMTPAKNNRPAAKPPKNR